MSIFNPHHKHKGMRLSLSDFKGNERVLKSINNSIKNDELISITICGVKVYGKVTQVSFSQDENMNDKYIEFDLRVNFREQTPLIDELDIPTQAKNVLKKQQCEYLYDVWQLGTKLRDLRGLGRNTLLKLKQIMEENKMSFFFHD